VARSLPYGEDVAKPAIASNRWGGSSTLRERLDRDQQNVALSEQGHVAPPICKLDFTSFRDDVQIAGGALSCRWWSPTRSHSQKSTKPRLTTTRSASTRQPRARLRTVADAPRRPTARAKPQGGRRYINSAAEVRAASPGPRETRTTIRAVQARCLGGWAGVAGLSRCPPGEVRGAPA
jgi:hypothetical protein